MDQEHLPPTRYNREHSSTGWIPAIRERVAREVLGREIFQWVTIGRKTLGDLGYFGYKDQDFDGTPLALVDVPKAFMYVDSFSRQGATDSIDRRPNFNSFAIREAMIPQDDFPSIERQILDHALAFVADLMALPDTARVQGQGLLYVWHRAELKIVELNSAGKYK